MFHKRKAVKKLEAIKGEYPYHPFVDLDQPEVRQQAVRYLLSRPLEHRDGESEYVVRNVNLPNRMHTFPDQRLWLQLRRHKLQEEIQIVPIENVDNPILFQEHERIIYTD